MDREDVAYLVNTTPKYFYLLPLHFALVRRYASKLKWPIYLATEVPEDPMILRMAREFSVTILPIEMADRYFLESRLAAVKGLPSSIKYVVPIQEDFLLQARPDYEMMEESLHILDTDQAVSSIRWMPCPGPKEAAATYSQGWKILKDDEYMFTFQATIWRREDYILFFSALLEIPESLFTARAPQGLNKDQMKKWIQVDFNLAENPIGQRKFREVLGDKVHLAYAREHPKPNAVYLSPWPYRPTAVEKGKLGAWVIEFAQREGYQL
jgi:hypothetical protein